MTSTMIRNTAALAGVGLVATPLIALGAPAFAAADTCTAIDAGATEVVPGVCELQYVEAGDFTFTPTSGIAKLTALIVGGGGATMYDFGTYTGGGGAVVYVANVDTSADVAITVAIGAQDASTAQGGSSSVNADSAAGGYSGYHLNVNNGSGGNSGNGNLGSSYSAGDEGAGGGAGGAAVLGVGGVGVTASSVANDADLWPALAGEPVYGQGGDVSPTNPGFGEAGWGGDGSSQRDMGADGLVVLRWTMKSDELPATGFNGGLFAVIAAAFMIPGTALLAFGMRGRRARAQQLSV